MLRLDVTADAIAMAGSGVDDWLRHAALAHNLLRTDAVLLGKLFKIQIVQESYYFPKIGVGFIAQLLGIPAHHLADRDGVLQMKRLLVEFGQ